MTNMFSPKRKAVSVMRNTGGKSGNKTTKSDVSDADRAVTDAPVDNTDMDKIGGDICPIS